MASLSSRRRSRFSAKFSRAAGKKRAPGMRSRFSSVTVPRVSSMTPQNDQTVCQNSSGDLIDQS